MRARLTSNGSDFMKQQNIRTKGLVVAAIVAILFGTLTIFSGSQVLFGGAEARAAAGNIVPFVLWFNFFAGFAYILAGIGLFGRNRWAVWLAGSIAVATLLVFAALGMHIAQDGAYEMRTVAAMTLRSVVWVALAAYAALTLRQTPVV